MKENKNSTEKAIKKTRKQELDKEKKEKTFFFFLDHFLDHFLGEFLCSYFLVFFYKFPPQNVLVRQTK